MDDYRDLCQVKKHPGNPYLLYSIKTKNHPAGLVWLGDTQWLGERMAGKLDQIIVVDIESTCWEGDPPPGEENEIIEIGVCQLDIAAGQRSKKRAILVRPERSKVSEFCTRLTSLTQAQVEEGLSFAEAIELLRKEYRPAERTWASYGDYDRIQIQRQCEQRGVAYPFGRTHLNVKNLLAISLNLPHEVGLERAVQLFHLPLEGTHHRGEDDAWNIAAVLAELLRRARRGADPAAGGPQTEE